MAGLTPPKSSNTLPEQAETVTDAMQLMALVQRIVSDRLLVSVQVEGLDTEFTSTVIGVKPDDGGYLLDWLYPEEGNAALLEGRSFTLFARFEGASMMFEGRVRERREEAGLAFFFVPLPESITYFQRRARHRVVLGADAPQLEFCVADTSYNASVHDISAAGVGFSLKREKAISLAVEQTLHDVLIRAHGRQLGPLELVIRDMRETERSRVIIGCQIMADEPHTVAQIERFVMDLERRQIQRRQQQE